MHTSTPAQWVLWTTLPAPQTIPIVLIVLEATTATKRASDSPRALATRDSSAATALSVPRRVWAIRWVCRWMLVFLLPISIQSIDHLWPLGLMAVNGQCRAVRYLERRWNVLQDHVIVLLSIDCDIRISVFSHNLNSLPDLSYRNS